jgi:hypothetical protein
LKLGWAVLVAAGCGRIDFDEPGSICPLGEPPATLTVTGTTFRYTSFIPSDTAAVGTTTVTALDGTTVLAMTTSDAAGVYSLTFPSGSPRPLALRYERTGYHATIVQTVDPVDASIAGETGAIWTLGDGPLWNDVMMTNVYTAAGQTWDPTLGTVTVNVRDCAGNGLAGATITFDRSVAVAYQGAGGMFDLSTEATLAPYAQLVAMRLAPMPITVSATAPGLRFGSVMVTPTPGDTIFIEMHGAR